MVFYSLAVPSVAPNTNKHHKHSQPDVADSWGGSRSNAERTVGVEIGVGLFCCVAIHVTGIGTHDFGVELRRWMGPPVLDRDLIA